MVKKTFREIEHDAWSARAREYDTLFAAVSTQAIDYILDSFDTLKGKRHLDVACGTGHLVATASKLGAISEGVDFAEPMVDIARTAYPQASFQVADATKLPHDNKSLDAVTCSFGLSHMEHSQMAVNEAFRVLKPGGHFAFTLWFAPEDGNEFQQIVRDTLKTFVTTPPALPEEWIHLRFANRQICEGITRQAGFGAPSFKKLPIVWRIPSPQDVGAFFDKMSIRTKLIMDRQPPAIQQQIRAAIVSKIDAYRMNGIISLAWPALLTVVQKPQ